MSGALVVRAAVVSDAGAIAAIHVASWRSAYAGILPASRLQAQSVSHRREQWLEWIEDPAVCVLVAERDGAVRGFVAALAARHPGALPDTGEVAALYVAPETVGAGLGSALLTAAESALRDRGCTRAELEVLEDNAPAVAFYKRRGYTPEARDPDHLEGRAALRMSRAL